jgi:hypothetical protein
MEKLSGHSLRTIIDEKGALPVDTACRFMIELMSALNCAHDAGIVHRDIKPENIFIARDSVGVTTLKLLDFGIMTSTGTRTVDRKGFMGTARYSSPEQMSEDHEATPQSDLYSASLVFYELVCGVGPYDTLYEIPELMDAHRNRPPPPPSRFRPGIPASLEDLILRGLAKKPGDRQPDAFSYAEDVSRILQELRTSGGSIAAAPAPVMRIAPPANTTIDAAYPEPAIARSPNKPSLTDIDAQVAQDFARVSKPKVDEPGTMGATHSTMPGLPTHKNRAWILVGAAALVIGIGVLVTMKSRSDAAQKNVAADPAPPSATIPPATTQTASAILPVETAPIVSSAIPATSATASAIAAPTIASSPPKASAAPKKNQPPKVVAPKDDMPWATSREGKTPGSGL